MAAVSQEKRLARIRGRKRWDTILALVSGAVLLLVAYILFALAADVFRGAGLSWKRAEVTLDVTYPSAEELFEVKPSFAFESGGILSPRSVMVEDQTRLNDKIAGSIDTYIPYLIEALEQATDLSSADFARENRGLRPLPETYEGQMNHLFIALGPFFKERLAADPSLAGQTETLSLAFSTDADAYLRGFEKRLYDSTGRISISRMSPFQRDVLDTLVERGTIKQVWNFSFLTNAYPTDRKTLAGIGAAIQSSLLMMFIVILLSLPIGVASAIYLEFFAPRQGLWGWLTTIVEININNLASVPSIVFGLMGLYIFVGIWGPIFVFDTGLATPIVGGLILSLMTLPTIVVTSRAALLAVPPSFQQAAYGIGATKMQTIFRFVLPYAFPGIVTGVIIGLAQAIGESAPLIVIGMVISSVDVCTTGFMCLEESSPSLPTAIISFRRLMDGDQLMTSRSYLTIIVLLAIVLSMNALASYIRGRIARSRQG